MIFDKPKLNVAFFGHLILFIIAFASVGYYLHTHLFISMTYGAFTLIIAYGIFLELRERLGPTPATKPIAEPVASSPANLSEAINTVLPVTSPAVTSPAPITYVSTKPETPTAPPKLATPSIHDAIIGKRRID